MTNDEGRIAWSVDFSSFVFRPSSGVSPILLAVNRQALPNNSYDR